MAGRKNAAKAGTAAAQTGAAATAPADREKLTDKQLAKAVLAHEIRPRVGEVRRLAEAVLKKSAAKAAKKPKGKAKKAKSGKLARIPQKKKKLNPGAGNAPRAFGIRRANEACSTVL